MIDLKKYPTTTIWQVSWKVVYRVGKEEHHLHREQHELFTEQADAEKLMADMTKAAKFIGIESELVLTISPAFVHGVRKDITKESDDVTT